MPDVPTIRNKIQAKLDSGGLPDHIPEQMGGGFGGGHACDACDDPILLGQAEYTYELGGGRILRLHIGCARLWQAELLRRRAESRGE